ncbi:MAG: AbrB/MazE/SpoVT family DNA-binding domain-containing protein [Betaproteobacteria bacterium]
MDTTRLSSKGQVVLPSAIRAARNLQPGAEFTVEDTPDGVLLRPLKPFPPTRVDEVFGSAGYRGQALSLAQMDAAVADEAKKRRRR